MASEHIQPTTYAAPNVAPSRPAVGLLPRLRDATRAWLGIETPALVATVEDTTDIPTDSQDWPSIDVVYDEVQDIVEAQNERLKIIDTKANFGLAAATLLTAGVTGLGRALVESGQVVDAPQWPLFGGTMPVKQITDAVTVLSLVIYAAIAVSTYIAYRIQTFREVANPMRLVDVYLYKDPAYTKAALSKQRAKNFDTNEKKLNGKATWVNRAMALLIAEAGLLVVIAAIQIAWL